MRWPITEKYPRCDMKRFALALLFLIGLAFPAAAQPPSPTELVKERVSAVLDVLKSDEYRQADAKKRMDMLKAKAIDYFDKEEIARRSLGANWKKFSPEQQQEFIRLYEEFLKQRYLSEIGDYDYEGEQVRYIGERLEGNKARVETVVMTSDKEIPIDYSLKRSNGDWKVYDVRIEKISMVKNYRAQFSEILANGTPEKLLDTLRQRIQ